MPESGNWLLEDPLFRKWKNQDWPLLWIFGQPGRGKTFLSSKIIGYLHHEANSSVGYFFIKEDDQDSTSVDNIMRSITLQIAQNNPLFYNFSSKF
jgi:pantothenate kinase-related protein Tda10